MPSASSPTSPDRVADAAPALRLGVFPVAALAVEFSLGTSLPFLVPLFAALLLTGAPQRPPVLQLVQVLVLILAVTIGLGWIFASLAHSPARPPAAVLSRRSQVTTPLPIWALSACAASRPQR